MEKNIKDDVLLRRTYNLTEQNNGGESLILDIDFISNGDDGAEGVYENHTLTLHSYGNSVSLNLYGNVLQPKELRKLADFMELARAHAIELNEKKPKKQRHALLDPNDQKHFVFVPIAEFVSKGGKLEQHRMIFTEFQGRYNSKLLDRYENGIVYAKSYPHEKAEHISETVYVKCPAKAEYV